MRLITQENEELNGLLELKKSRTIPMMQSGYERLMYLLKKHSHNTCSNPRCDGYEASEFETICPNCGRSILKLI